MNTFVFLTTILLSLAQANKNELQCACMLSHKCIDHQRQIVDIIKQEMEKIADEFDILTELEPVSDPKSSCVEPKIEKMAFTNPNTNSLFCNNTSTVKCMSWSDACAQKHKLSASVVISEDIRHVFLEKAFVDITTPKLKEAIISQLEEAHPDCWESFGYNLCACDALIYLK